jgi:hypothetical protein
VWKHYSLSIVLFGMFLVSWILQTWSGWREFRAEEQAHGEAAQWFGESGYVWVWLRSTMENWQSEFLQLFTFVVLTSFLSHTGSPESKDSEDKVEQSLERIEEAVGAGKG